MKTEVIQKEDLLAAPRMSHELNKVYLPILKEDLKYEKPRQESGEIAKLDILLN